MLSADRVLELLEPQYGPFVWEPRCGPIAEVVFTILSQHTSDVNSEKAFARLMERFDSPERIADADVGDIAECVEMAGLANVKAPRIKSVLQEIRRRIGALNLESLRYMSLETAKEWLTSIQGLGPKSAAVILCFSLGMPAMAVDTHVYRVARRLGLIEANVGITQAHLLLEQMIAPDRVYSFHVSLITHGRQVCKARRPHCEQCPLAVECPGSWV